MLIIARTTGMYVSACVCRSEEAFPVQHWLFHSATNWQVTDIQYATVIWGHGDISWW